MKTHGAEREGGMSLDKASAADIFCLFCSVATLLQEIRAYCIFRRFCIIGSMEKVALVLQNAADSKCFNSCKKQLNKFREEKSIKSN